jgi:hypothetical protein
MRETASPRGKGDLLVTDSWSGVLSVDAMQRDGH